MEVSCCTWEFYTLISLGFHQTPGFQSEHQKQHSTLKKKIKFEAQDSFEQDYFVRLPVTVRDLRQINSWAPGPTACGAPSPAGTCLHQGPLVLVEVTPYCCLTALRQWLSSPEK